MRLDLIFLPLDRPSSVSPNSTAWRGRSIRQSPAVCVACGGLNAGWAALCVYGLSSMLSLSLASFPFLPQEFLSRKASFLLLSGQSQAAYAEPFVNPSNSASWVQGELTFVCAGFLLLVACATTAARSSAGAVQCATSPSCRNGNHHITCNSLITLPAVLMSRC